MDSMTLSVVAERRLGSPWSSSGASISKMSLWVIASCFIDSSCACSMFSVPTTKRRAVRGGGGGRWERAEEEVAGLVLEAVLAEVSAPLALPFKFLILSSISTRLLCHCFRRGKRRAVPDATLGTETKTSKWFEAGMGRHEAETSPQHSEGGELVEKDTPAAAVLRISELLS